MAILELKAARAWSLQKTAEVFLVTPATIASWLGRINEDGKDALVQVPEPVNKFPRLVRHVVQRLKTLCPAMGRVKIAQTLARAGLHLGKTTVGRMLKDGEGIAATQPDPTPEIPEAATQLLQQAAAQAAHGKDAAPRVVTAKRSNHVWHVDLTAVPIAGGFWTSWFPFAFPQCWPFCWWVAIAVDHYSRRIMGVTVFAKCPTSQTVRAFLGRAIHKAGQTPRYLICDKGMQFWCSGFKAWCKRKKIRPRFGAIGHHGSIAVVERLILSLKRECTRLLLVPYRREHFRRELLFYAHWYNRHRPHTTLRGRTPHEVYEGLSAANRAPRLEPRSRWPRGSPCAGPQTLVKGQPGSSPELHVTFYKGRKHLPIVSLTPAA